MPVSQLCIFWNFGEFRASAAWANVLLDKSWCYVNIQHLPPSGISKASASSIVFQAKCLVDVRWRMPIVIEKAARGGPPQVFAESLTLLPGTCSWRFCTAKETHRDASGRPEKEVALSVFFLLNSSPQEARDLRHYPNESLTRGMVLKESLINYLPQFPTP
jgi:hypothetical protein